MVLRAMCWMMTAIAAVVCPLTMWLAVTRDWTAAPVGLLIGLGAVLMRLSLRKTYGVREPAESAALPKTHAEAVAEAVEARRQQQWDAIAERAYRATGGQVDRPAPRPPELRPGAAYDVSTTLDRDGYSGTAPVRSASPCAHKNAVPVDLLVTGERVAWTCPDCPARLPADWRS
jgi:hypothetical protein